MNSEKITGWVPYHPSVGAMVDHVASTENGCWLSWLGPNWAKRIRKAAIPDIETGYAVRALDEYNGWRIRPVEIVFTDEGEK